MFHVRCGFYVRRVGDHKGDVEIVKRADATDSAALVFRMTMTAKEWASLVASVSRRGETAETFMAAYQTHMEPDSRIEAEAAVEADLTQSR